MQKKVLYTLFCIVCMSLHVFGILELDENGCCLGL